MDIICYNLRLIWYFIVCFCLMFTSSCCWCKTLLSWLIILTLNLSLFHHVVTFQIVTYSWSTRRMSLVMKEQVILNNIDLYENWQCYIRGIRGSTYCKKWHSSTSESIYMLNIPASHGLLCKVLNWFDNFFHICKAVN